MGIALAGAHQGNYGVTPETLEGIFFARGGNVCEGYCYPLAILQQGQITADTTTLNVYPGSNDSIWASVSASTSSQAVSADQEAKGSGIYVIAKESALDTKTFRGVVKGFCRAAVANRLAAVTGISGANSIAIGRELYPTLANSSANTSGTASYARHLDTTPYYNATQFLGRKSIGICLTSITSMTAFDGGTALNGSGNSASDGGYATIYFDGTGIGAAAISLSN